MQWLGNEFLWQLTLPGFALAVFGLIVLFRRRQIAQAGSGMLVFLGNSIVLIVLLGFDFDFFQVAVFRPYSLLCYGIVALWLSLGLQVVLDDLAERLSARSALKISMAMLVGAMLVGWSIRTHWRANDRADSDFAEHYAAMQLDFLPKDSILFVFGDETGPMGYYQYIENRRPDVALYNLQGLVFGNRPYGPLLSRENKKKGLEQFIDATDHALFFPLDVDPLPNRKGRIYGFFLEALKEGQPGTIELERHLRGEEYFAQLIAQQPLDRWERVRRNGLLYQYGRYLGLIYFAGDPVLLDPMQELFGLAEESYACLLGMADIVLANNGNSTHWDQVSTWLAKAEALKHEALRKKTLAQLSYLQGSLLQRQGQKMAAIASFRESRDVYPHPENKALGILAQYKGNLIKGIDMSERERPTPAWPSSP